MESPYLHFPITDHIEVLALSINNKQKSLSSLSGDKA
jgi:hypothetical protein